jgi:hypothetical protein
VFVQSFLDETNFVARVLGMVRPVHHLEPDCNGHRARRALQRKTAPIFWSFMDYA